jgi:hypothetical protein
VGIAHPLVSNGGTSAELTASDHCAGPPLVNPASCAALGMQALQEVSQ